MKYLIPSLFIIIFLGVPLMAAAQCTQLPVGSAQFRLCTLILDIGDILRVFGIALALIIIVWSGIQYMTAGADQTKLDNAKKTLIWGIVGVAIVFAAYFIVGLVQDFLEGYGFTYNLMLMA